MPTQMYMNTYAHKRLYIYTYIYMYNVLGYCIHMLLWFNFACSDVLSWWFECMFHVAFYISEVGRVGTCSFPMLWCVFRSRPTHTSFPTLRWGTIQQSSRLYIMKEQFLCAKVSIVKCNDDWLRCYAASSIEIELPFDRSRRKQVPSRHSIAVPSRVRCVCGDFENQPNRLFEMLYVGC